MSSDANGFLDRSKPWRSDVKWPVVAIEAVILIAVGIFMLVATERAGNWLLQIIGVVLLLVSLQSVAESIRSVANRFTAVESFRSGIGVTIGVIATSLWWSDYVAVDAVRLILGWGLVAYALVQLLGLASADGRAQLGVSTLALSALTLVLGFLLLTSNESTAEDRLRFLGVVLLVFGILLGGLAYLIRSQNAATAE